MGALTRGRDGFRRGLALVAGLLAWACHEERVAAVAGPAPALVHLADALERAEVASAAAPERAAIVWSFDEARPEWAPVPARRAPWLVEAGLAREGDVGRMSLERPAEGSGGPLVGGIEVELDAPAPLASWAGVVVRARSSSRLAGLAVTANPDRPGAAPGVFALVGGHEGTAPVFNDGSVQAYSLPIPGDPQVELRGLALFLGAMEPGALDLLSIELVPRGADFAEDAGVRAVTRGGETRRALFAHAPATLRWRVTPPERARLDVGLACLPGEAVAFRIEVADPDGPTALLEETIDDDSRWHQRSLDLARFAGREVELVLRAAAESAGSVALWGAPILSGARPDAAPPNVVFYVIDGGGADLMSLYGYERATTPFLERLAREGVVFERAHSNSTWTQPSTVSFMTSLHHSVLGGLRRGVHSTPLPARATTLAEHMRRAGYATSSFTANPNAGRMVGLERGIDAMRDARPEHHSTSSVDLHAWLAEFRAAYPAEPYFAHLQTTDVHEPNEPVAPYAGRFVPAELRERVDEWDGQLWSHGGGFGRTSIAAFYDEALERAGIDRHAYYDARRGLYDETMAHQDAQLARFVEHLKESGEWERTLLVIGSDHGHPAGTFARFGRGLAEPRPEEWQGALFDAWATRVPLLFVWPGGIEGGRRCDVPVSMIDVLPTVLDLVGLERPEPCQGRSLAPFLRGAELAPEPVVLDEFRVDEATGELIGNLELIDGRWGASLEIGPVPPGADASRGRRSVPAGGRWGAVHPFFPDAPRLLLYDLEADPFALSAVNREHPELVERYQRELLALWEVHRALAEGFVEADGGELTPETLQQLRTLGYVR